MIAYFLKYHVKIKIQGYFPDKNLNFECNTAVCKSAVADFDGSNPSPTTNLIIRTCMQQCKSFFIFTSSSGQGAAALLPAHSNRQESRITEAKMIRQIIPSAFIHPLVFGFFFSISMISADISFSGSCSWIVISVCLLFSVFRLKILIFILIFLPPFHRQRFFHKSHSNLRIILPEIQPHTCHHILFPATGIYHSGIIKSKDFSQVCYS